MNLLEFINKGSSADARVPGGEIGRIIGGIADTIPDISLPVNIEDSLWLTLADPERLSRSFKFNRLSHLSYFVNELLAYQERYNHHATILIDHMIITVETHTRDIEGVTQQDKNLARFCDEIYDDTRFLNISEENDDR
jgi:pterin-4a-carbinolamine dehydratase|tara:strand:+ start:4174 stop:4587 length:414 start_codon:yes stop_codon:yes gene_type:complete